MALKDQLKERQTTMVEMSKAGLISFLLLVAGIFFVMGVLVGQNLPAN